MGIVGSQRQHAGSSAKKDELTPPLLSASSSPSAASVSASVFSNGDARSSQSSAPSSVKSVPIYFDDDGLSLLSTDDIQSISSTESFGSNPVSNESHQTLFGSGTANSDCIAPGLRQNPRRTRPGPQDETSARPCPALVRQCDRKEQFVEALVGKSCKMAVVVDELLLTYLLEDTTTEMIDVVWPNPVASCGRSTGTANQNVIDLRRFVQEVLKRSKTSYSTLQVALYYLVLVMPFVSKLNPRMEEPWCRAMQCGRRMFLAALILASKYLQDRNFTMSAWAKISGLTKEEICLNEFYFLRAVEYDLHVPENLFQRWTDIVLKHSLDPSCTLSRMSEGKSSQWVNLIPKLKKNLVSVDDGESLARTWTDKVSVRGRSTDASSLPATASLQHAHKCSPLLVVAQHSAGLAPRIMEPKVQTQDRSFSFPPISPHPSKLPSPRLPPLVLGCAPAASVTRNVCARPAMRNAMQKACNSSIKRCTLDLWPCPSQTASPTPAHCRPSSLSRMCAPSRTPSPAFSVAGSQEATPTSLTPCALSTTSDSLAGRRRTPLNGGRSALQAASRPVSSLRRRSDDVPTSNAKSLYSMPPASGSPGSLPTVTARNPYSTPSNSRSSSPLDSMTFTPANHVRTSYIRGSSEASDDALAAQALQELSSGYNTKQSSPNTAFRQPAHKKRERPRSAHEDAFGTLTSSAESATSSGQPPAYHDLIPSLSAASELPSPNSVPRVVFPNPSHYRSASGSRSDDGARKRACSTAKSCGAAMPSLMRSHSNMAMYCGSQ